MVKEGISIHPASDDEDMDDAHTKPNPPIITVESFLKDLGMKSKRIKKTYARRGRKRLRTKQLDAGKEIRSDTESPVTRKDCYRLDRDDGEDVIQLRSREVPRKLASSKDGASSSETYENPSLNHAASSPPAPTKLPRKKKRSKAPKKSLKERIYEAAVSTYGDPDPDFMEVSEEAVGPLRFFPVNNIRGDMHSEKKRKRKEGCLVDPRKATVKYDTDFLCRARVPAALLRASTDSSFNDPGWGQACRSVWDERLKVPSISFFAGSNTLKEPGRTTPPDKKRKVKEKTGVEKQSDASPAGALVFIPLEEAAASYSALFKKRRWVSLTPAVHIAP
ncbi:hypothetical protein CPC08DRAFT_203236 [Agrocybe pediades]|nr:hypothetical protein CPC08DRAFT_203236 [Agrocybe pediades]